jgi:hypothetical protein
MDGVYGFVANSISIVTTQPIDVIKTNYQLSRINAPKTTANIVRDIWTKRGPMGFYSGLTPNLSTYPIFWSIYFGSSQLMSDKEVSSHKYVDKFIKSYGSGVVASTLANPLFVLKVRAQNVDGKSNMMEIIRQTNRAGYQAYFRGLGPTYLNNTRLAIQFPMYDYIKEQTDSIFVASIGSKVVSSSMLYPLDLIRVNQRNSDVRLKMWDVGKDVYMRNACQSNLRTASFTRGIRGLYQGVILYNLVSTPNFVIMMLGLEYMRKSL